MNDRTLVPIRAIVEAMGGTVEWHQDTQTAVLTMNGIEIRLVINSTIAYLNGEEKSLDIAPILINDRTLFPLRFIAENFEFDVAWNEQNRI